MSHYCVLLAWLLKKGFSKVVTDLLTLPHLLDPTQSNQQVHLACLDRCHTYSLWWVYVKIWVWTDSCWGGGGGRDYEEGIMTKYFPFLLLLRPLNTHLDNISIYLSQAFRGILPFCLYSGTLLSTSLVYIPLNKRV